MKTKLSLLLSAGLALSACTTTSFAPPDVNIRQEMTNNSLTPNCRPTNSVGDDLTADVDGALNLINNFIGAYRCTMREAADGRQIFELPSFLSLVGSTVAVALGAGTDVAIVGGIGNSVFTAGNRYYSPEEQTEILSDAVDALLCIQTEAVDIRAFDSTVPLAEQQLFSMTRSGGTVRVPIERQYYNMVASALLSVERVAAQRLSRRGSFDAAGVAAEIRRSAQEQRDAAAARDKPPPQQPAIAMMYGERAAAAARVVEMAELDLAVIRPKLQECVVRAKV
jgi:hypothetical protein